MCHIRWVGQGGLSANQDPAQPGHGRLVGRAGKAAYILDPRPAGERHATLADHAYDPAQIVDLRSRAWVKMIAIQEDTICFGSVFLPCDLTHTVMLTTILDVHVID